MRRADPKLPSPKGPGEAGRRPIAWRIPRRPALGALAILVSVLVHLALTAIVFLELDPRAPRHGALELEEQGFDVVFGGSGTPGAPVEIPPSPAPPMESSIPPPPAAMQVPPPPPPPAPEAPRLPQPPVQPPIPMPAPRPLAEIPAPPPPPPPSPVAEPPRPLPPQPQPAPPAAVPPVAQQQQAPPRPNAETRPPLDLSHLPPVRLGEQDYRPRNRLDFTLGPVPNAAIGVPNLQVRGAEDADDWQREFYRWLGDNLRYPRDAAELGEQGLVAVRIITAPDGTVRRVELVTPSRSITLNHYSQSVFRGAKLPAFKRATSNEVTIDLRIRYNLIRR